MQWHWQFLCLLKYSDMKEVFFNIVIIIKEIITTIFKEIFYFFKKLKT